MFLPYLKGSHEPHTTLLCSHTPLPPPQLDLVRQSLDLMRYHPSTYYFKEINKYREEDHEVHAMNEMAAASYQAFLRPG